MMATATEIGFTRLRSGEWGIKGPANRIRVGSSVYAEQRSGKRTVVKVTRIIWTGADTAIAAIEQDAKTRTTGRRVSASRAECIECGAPGPAGEACKECFEGHFV